MVDKDLPQDTYSEEETVARREAALKVMLATPHQKRKPLGRRKGGKADAAS